MLIPSISAYDPQRTSRRLFDHIIGAGEPYRRHVDAERLGAIWQLVSPENMDKAGCSIIP